MFYFHYDHSDYYITITSMVSSFYEVDVFKNGNDIHSAELIVSVGATKESVDWNDFLVVKDRDEKFNPKTLIGISYRSEEVLPAPVRIFVEQSHARYFNLIVFS